MTNDTPLNPTAFGKRIKALRTARGIGQGELARRAGLTAQYMSQIEAGSRPQIGLGVGMALASALRVSLDELTGFDLTTGRVVSTKPAAADSGSARLDALEQAVGRLTALVRRMAAGEPEQSRPAQKVTLAARAKRAVPPTGRRRKAV